MNGSEWTALDDEIEALAVQCRSHGKDANAVPCPMMEMNGDALNLDHPFECPFRFDICCGNVRKSDWDEVLVNG